MGALEWALALTKEWRSRRLVTSVQKTVKVNLKAIRAYRTVSTVAASMLAGASPLDLEGRRIKEGIRREGEREEVRPDAVSCGGEGEKEDSAAER